jgi:hypothetical protein
MLRDLADGINNNEVDCTRVRSWAEETLPAIHLKLVDNLRRLKLEEQPLLGEAPPPDSKVFYTRRERTWSTVRMVIPEARLPLMEVTVLGFTSDCGIKICFDRWLQRSCHESHFSLVLEPRREHRVIVIADKSVNCPFNKDVLELEEIVESLRARFSGSLSMCGFLTSGQAEKTTGSPKVLRH